MGQTVVGILVQGYVMKRFSGAALVRLFAILVLSVSLLIKGIQFACILAVTQESGASVEALAAAVSKTFGGGSDFADDAVADAAAAAASPADADASLPESTFILGSFEADRGLRVFAFIYLCVWIVVGGLAWIGVVFHRIMLIVMVNLVVYLMGLCAESLLVAALVPTRVPQRQATGGALTSFLAYFPLFIDCLTSFSLIVYCCWLTKNGMSFDPQEQRDDEEREERKQDISLSSTFRRFDPVDA